MISLETNNPNVVKAAESILKTKAHTEKKDQAGRLEDLIQAKDGLKINVLSGLCDISDQHHTAVTALVSLIPPGSVFLIDSNSLEEPTKLAYTAGLLRLTIGEIGDGRLEETLKAIIEHGSTQDSDEHEGRSQAD